MKVIISLLLAIRMSIRISSSSSSSSNNNNNHSLILRCIHSHSPSSRVWSVA